MINITLGILYELRTYNVIKIIIDIKYYVDYIINTINSGEIKYTYIKLFVCKSTS